MSANRLFIFHRLFIATALLFCCGNAFCQPNTSVDLGKDKPAKYKDRQLGAEKTGEKKFGFMRRTYQDMVSHYNYFFNANNLLNDIITRAKSVHKDDYTHLLPFYSYTLDATAQSKNDIDSIIYKCNAGILLHDLRNDWVDDLYMLMGKAYLLRKDFDSAEAVFQYLNYVYAPKDDGYDIPIGSNASNTHGIFTVSTNEKRSLLKKITGKPISRNEGFIWQIRNYLEQNKLPEASGLISILRNDPYFPKRLQTGLHELQAYLFYKQQSYDSAAWHLQKALGNADGKTEQSRWEYLCGQMYQAANNNEAAIALYKRAIKHTIDPYMDVYARLNIVSLSTHSQKGNVLQYNLNELYKLAKRDKYENYRDIIYYAAALLELKQKNNNAAISDLQKSIRFSIDNIQQKQKSFLLLADVNYDNKFYQASYHFYDSIQTNSLSATEKEKVELRKPSLKIITDNLTTIHLKDSLLALSNLKETERVAAVKKIYRQLRKAQGLKDNGDIDYGSAIGINNQNSNGGNLFNNNNTNSSDFYFANANLISQGYKDFKIRWGNRPNVDNWQRQAAINNATTVNLNAVDIDQPAPGAAKDNTHKDVTFESLLLNIPVTEKQMEDANNAIIDGFFKNGEVFQNTLEEYTSAIDSYESLLHRYPENKYEEQVLFNLVYCYRKLGITAKSDSARRLLQDGFPTGKYNALLKNGNINKQKDAATEAYGHIYDLFIEGRFDEAKAAKEKADNQFGKSYWTPQLLYIESVYYVKQKEDSTAINRLVSLEKNFPSSPMAEKAETLIDVLKRRKEIEDYLMNLKVEKNEDAIVGNIDLDPAKVVSKPAPAIDTIASVMNKEIKPTGRIKEIPKPVIISKNSFTFNPVDSQYVMVVLDKVDAVFVSEARNAFNRFNQENFYSRHLNITPEKLNGQYNLMLIGPFENAGDALTYLDKTKPFAGSRIIPWLKAGKYNFGIISNNNLEILRTNKDASLYTKFLKDIFPDKF